MSIEPDLAKSLSEKSDQELIGILENPADWMPEVVDFARSELGRRSISTAQIEQRNADCAKQKAEESLSVLETISAALEGGGLGLLGLFFVWLQASKFKSNGYLLKSKKMWKIATVAFGIRVVIVLLLVAYFIITSSGRSQR